MGLRLHGSSTWSSTTLRIRIFSCWRVHETLGKGLTPAGTFPAGGDERSGGSDVEVAFLVATGVELSRSSVWCGLPERKWWPGSPGGYAGSPGGREAVRPLFSSRDTIRPTPLILSPAYWRQSGPSLSCR